MRRLTDRRLPNWLTSWFQERRYAKRMSVDLLHAYEIIRPMHRELSGEALYERVIAHERMPHLESAREIIRLAKESFAQRPAERSLTFRDVVSYLAISTYLDSEPRSFGSVSALNTCAGEAG